MIKRRMPRFGKEAFPRHSGEQLGRTPYKRCVNCNMPNDTRSTAWSDNGDGLGVPTEVTVDGEVQENVMDRAVNSGCRFCGSLKWQDSKPVALPDDRNFPSERNKRRRYSGR